MFFEQEYIVFELLDVLYLEQTNINMYNSNRNFDALSFRYDAETMLSTEKQQIEVLSNSICYVPSNLSYTRKAENDRLIVIHFKAFNYHSEKIECFYPEAAEKYKELFCEILRLWNKKDVSYRNECASLLSKILSELYKDNQSTAEKSKIHPSVMYIQKNCLHRDFSLSDAARRSFISDVYFRKLFRKEFNMSPKRYVIECRIEYAKALILSGYFSVGEVASLCGYNDEKHFSSEFKRITGVSPSKYDYNYAPVN